MVSIGVETTKETGERRGVIQHLDRVLVCARTWQEKVSAGAVARARVPVSAPSETSKGSDVMMPHLSTNQMCNVRMGFGARGAAMAKRGAPAEGACLKPGHTRLEAGLGGGSALLVGQLGLGGERHVQKHLWRHDKHVRRDAVARHPILAFLDRLVEAELLLLRDGVHHHLVVHRGADVALGAQVLGAVVLRKDKHATSVPRIAKGRGCLRG